MARVVVSGGKLATVGRKSWPLPSRTRTETLSPRGVELLRSLRWATFEHITRTQPWVFAAVSRLTFWTARIPYKLYDGELSDTRSRVLDHDLAGLIKKPNPGMRWKLLMLEWAWDYYVHAHGLLVKYRPAPGAMPTELWPVPWRYVAEIRDEAERILGFKVQLGGQSTAVHPADAVHIRWPAGIAPLEALARTVQSEDAALTYQTEALRGGITPRAAFTTTDKLGKTDFERLREELGKLYGGPDAAGNFALLHNGLKYDKPIGISPRQLGLDDMRKLSREETAAAFDVSPPFLGILDRATFNNIQELRAYQYEDSLGPKIDMIETTLQSQLIDAEAVWSAAGLFIEADMAAILKPNPEAQARQALMEQQSSTTSIDERRRIRNLRPYGIAGVTDVPLIPANMYPAGSTPSNAGGAAGRTLTDDLTAEAFRAGGPPAPKEDQG